MVKARLMDTNSSGYTSGRNMTTMKILKAQSFIASLNLSVANINSVAAPILHLNCEGCEYEVLEAIVNQKLLRIFSVIQVSFHYFPSVSNAFSRYCKLFEYLSKYFVYQEANLAFGWERWVNINQVT